MAAVSTVYEVTTRFITDEHRAIGGINRLGVSMKRMDRNLFGLTRRFKFLFGASGALSVGAAVGKTFHNLNVDLERGIGLTGQINAQFKLATDPVDNFNLAMGRSRALMTALTKDAAKLPGEVKDFAGTAQLISGGIFAAGGRLTDLRKMTGQLSLIGGAIGQTQADVGRQAQALLFGQAGLDRPLFAFLHGAGFLPDAKTFNALPAAKAFTMLDKAMSKFVDNPAFRSQSIRTFSTQWGSLMDNLFGSGGIGGRAGKRPFGFVLDGFVDMNAWLEKEGPRIGNNMAVILAGFEGAGNAVDRIMNSPFIKSAMASDRDAANAAKGGAGLLGTIASPLIHALDPMQPYVKGGSYLERMARGYRTLAGDMRSDILAPMRAERERQLRAPADVGLGQFDSDVPIVPGGGTAPIIIHNNITVKGDHNFGAIAVKTRRAVEDGVRAARMNPSNVLRPRED